jgi:hypothetical protein
MATKKNLNLLGGKSAALRNPHNLVKKYKAVCVTDKIVLSPDWRDSRDEARLDALDHIAKRHLIDYDTKISDQ